MLRAFKIFLLCCLSLWALSPVVSAEDKKADYYQPLYSKAPEAKPLKDPVSWLIELPFKLVKWPVDKALVMTENYRLDKKTRWIYDQMIEYGFRPRLDSLDFLSPPSYGADFDFMRIFRLKEAFPDLLANGWISHGPTTFFQVGTEIGAQKIAQTGLHVSGIFQYENRRDETFYGIGPRSSLGDATTYIKETTTVGSTVGYEFSPVLDLSIKAVYDHVNIKNRRHDDKGDITQTFASQNIPGLHGDQLLKLSAGVTRDTRDNKGDATKGSYQKLLFKFTEGLNSSPAQYFTYQLDAAKYLQLASPRRVLAARLFGEFNQTVNGGDVPFYEMTKLGGSGNFPRLGQTSRAFVYNRFTGQSAILLNLEYRYTVWEYKEFKMKTAIFVDEGQVSKGFGTFQFKNFRESYGVGFYLTYSQLMLLDFTVAHGNEGTQFYLETTLPF